MKGVMAKSISIQPLDFSTRRKKLIKLGQMQLNWFKRTEKYLLLQLWPPQLLCQHSGYAEIGAHVPPAKQNEKKKKKLAEETVYKAEQQLSFDFGPVRNKLFIAHCVKCEWQVRRWNLESSEESKH